MSKTYQASVDISDYVSDKIENEAGNGIIEIDNEETTVKDALVGLDSRVNKVGAGAAALAALHPLDYDADNKFSMSAGYGNYAGANAVAIGAFYRPDENIMLNVGGTFGNGENIVNLGVAFAIGNGKSPYLSMSKRDLIAEVQSVKADNQAMKEKLDELETVKEENRAMRDELDTLKAIVAELAKER